MDRDSLRQLLERCQKGDVSLDEGVDVLMKDMGEKLGFAHIDRQREARQGFPEVVYAAGKTAVQVAAILSRLAADSKGSVMATRVSPEQAEAVRRALPEAVYDEVSRIAYIRRATAPVDEARRILVLTAGTSDIPVAAEAALTAELMGNAVDTCYDVGVAGIGW
mgnify:CR=1 FL=1